MSKKRTTDEFDEEPTFGKEKIMSLLSLGGRGFAAGAICAALILLGLVIWIAYPGDDVTNEVPIIRAESGSYKSTPDEPGGMAIPHRDSTIFSAQGNPDGRVENLLADNATEAPMEKSDLFAGLNTDMAAAPPQPEATQVEPMREPVESEDLVPAMVTNTAPKQEAPAAAPAPAEQKQAAAAPTEELQAAKAEPAAGAATAAPKVIASGTHFVQLASITDKAKAAAAYKDLQKKFPSLANMDYRVETADLGAKGIFYRIQAGPVAKADADKACAAIKSASGSCLTVAK